MVTSDAPSRVDPKPATTPEKGLETLDQGLERVSLDQIQSLETRTRALNSRHVRALAESIAAVGLIHPPALDRQGRLLAGAHRLAALRWLQSQDPPRFQELFGEGVPVRRMDFDAEADAQLALAVEISENERRRDYSSGEIVKLADRLQQAGFHYSAGGGRPKGGTKALMPALELIVGKSVRQLRRTLNPAGPPSPPKTRTYDLVSELRHLLAFSTELGTQLEAQDRPELVALRTELGRVGRMAERALAALT